MTVPTHPSRLLRLIALGIKWGNVARVNKLFVSDYDADHQNACSCNLRCFIDRGVILCFKNL